MNLNLWKARKKELKLTFKRLAQISGIPKRTIEDIFSERTKNPRIDTIQAIEKALEISSLSSEKINAGALDSVSTSFNLSEKEKHLLELFNSLSENMKNLLIQTAENFVSASGNANNKVKRA